MAWPKSFGNVVGPSLGFAPSLGSAYTHIYDTLSFFLNNVYILSHLIRRPCHRRYAMHIVVMQCTLSHMPTRNNVASRSTNRCTHIYIYDTHSFFCPNNVYSLSHLIRLLRHFHVWAAFFSPEVYSSCLPPVQYFQSV